MSLIINNKGFWLLTNLKLAHIPGDSTLDSEVSLGCDTRKEIKTWLSWTPTQNPDWHGLTDRLFKSDNKTLFQ